MTTQTYDIRVCKKLIKSTLNISDHSIRTVCSKITRGMISVDFQGKHEHHSHVDENIQNSVKQHVESIPRIESYYRHQDTSKEYIDGTKTVAQIYSDYVCNYKKKFLPYVICLVSSRIFNTVNNICFFRPKKN